MSLVAYDDSSDEEDAGEAPAAGPAPPPRLSSAIGPQPRPPSPSRSARPAPQHPAPSQNVASTNSRSSSRKRESNGSVIPPRSKFPRAPSAQPRGARNAAASTLVPPQLSGRSNVVTEDMGRLFVARRKE
ncbi:unnamed protein product [Alopecurus aequalis]